MSSARRRPASSRAFTLVELLVVIAIVALLMAIALPGIQGARQQAQVTHCAANLHGIGQGVHHSFTENRGYGPSADDAEPGAPAGHQAFMLTWVDVLFDGGYISDYALQVCDADLRPDPPAYLRGRAWNSQYVDRIGSHEPPKYGVRTSYGLSSQMHYNQPRDRFPDPARQVYAIDAWWTWFGNLSAYWLAHQRVYGWAPDVLHSPTAQGSMVAWRHGRRYGASGLMLDGHVQFIAPRLNVTPETISQTLDTSRYFTWLPGESTNRNDFDAYDGDVSEWAGRVPYWKSVQPAGHEQPGRGKRMNNGTIVPYDFPEIELFAAEKTLRQAWKVLPQQSVDRK